MKTVDAIKTLCDLDRDGRAVFTVAELRSIFPERSGNTFTAGLRRLMARGILKRAAHGVYVNALSRSPRLGATRRWQSACAAANTAMSAWNRHCRNSG